MSKAGVTSEAKALAIAKFKKSRLNNHNADPTRNQPLMKCTKCGLDNHIIKGYYEIIGYPEGWVHKGQKKDLSRPFFAYAESSTCIITSIRYIWLQSLVTQLVIARMMKNKKENNKP
ncbi:unnamed protein product [Prunus armeniaca]